MIEGLNETISKKYMYLALIFGWGTLAPILMLGQFYFGIVHSVTFLTASIIYRLMIKDKISYQASLKFCIYTYFSYIVMVTYLTNGFLGPMIFAPIIIILMTFILSSINFSVILILVYFIHLSIVAVIQIWGEVDLNIIYNFERHEYLLNTTFSQMVIVTFLCFISYIFASLLNKSNKSLKYEKDKMELQNNEKKSILNNISYGIIKISKTKSFFYQSKYVHSVFGSDYANSQNIVDMLLDNADIGDDIRSRIRSAINVSIGENRIFFELNRHLLPKEITLHLKGEKRILELSWDTVENNNNEINSILLSVKDITKIRLAEKESIKKQRSIQILTELIELHRDEISNFFEWCNKLLQQIEKIINRKTLTSENVKKILRDLHTIKGTSRMYSFSYLVESIHSSEKKYHDLLNYPENISNFEKNLLKDDLNLIKISLSEYLNVYNSKLLAFSKSNSDEKEKHEEFTKKFLSIADYIGDEKMISDKFFELYKYVYANEFESLATLCKPLASSLSSLAFEIGKKGVNINFSESPVRFNKREARILNDILIHCLRNSIDHGIEVPEDRIKKGKPEIGTITLRLMMTDKYGVIEIEDDGAGLNLNVLKKKGAEKQQITEGASVQQLADLIFSSGISTASKVTEISGRGVGMYAVKSLLREKGGKIEIRLKEKPNVEGYISFSIFVYLPKKYFFEQGETEFKTKAS